MDYELEPTTQDHSRQVQWLRGTSDAIGVLPWTYGTVNSLQYGRSDEYKGVHKDMRSRGVIREVRWIIHKDMKAWHTENRDEKKERRRVENGTKTRNGTPKRLATSNFTRDLSRARNIRPLPCSKPQCPPLAGTVKIVGDIELFYEESGLSGLDPTNYTTVVFIHRMGFNGVCERIEDWRDHSYWVVFWCFVPRFCFSQPRRTDNEELRDLESYLHTVAYYDMSLVTMGLPSPRPYQSFLFAPTVEERWEIFKQWIPSFFAHPNIYSRDSSDLELIHPREDKPGSLRGLTDDEIAEMTAPQMYATHGVTILAIKPEVFESVVRHALFDKQYPSRFVCGTESSGLFVHVVNEIRRCLGNGPSIVLGKGAEKARDVGGPYLEKGNHFVFLDEPQWALVQFKSVVEH
ncbi:hypothetical protein M404DRAFT_7226 [Pisolithus tinctorius Marx 270]|uniref:Uncharacterized protein n=1 Tax=Pisolithus tinctorius Marx 270 TaxID=870435 RepID=A0A0C3PBJ8_PISTI|nr:hypothetical protein M404DRAFT_7226 [Pisolithus tinctorius Marx 270]